MSELATLALTGLAGLCFALATSVVVALLVPFWRSRGAGAPPARRARSAFALAVAPSVVPTVAILLCLAPGLLAGLGIHRDHCPLHPSHPHLCLVHPSASLTPALGVGLALAAGLVLAGGVREGLRLLRRRRALAHLAANGSTRFDGDAYVVQSPRAFCFATGMWHAVIYLSTGLLEGLSVDQRRVILAHERAHVVRRDGLRRLAARVLSVLHGPRTRRTLLREMTLAEERACDEAAAAAVGDRIRVAETLLRVERLIARSGAETCDATAFGGSSVPERVRALLGPRSEPLAPGRPAWLVGAGLLLALALLANPLHHATEHLLALLLALF